MGKSGRGHAPAAADAQDDAYAFAKHCPQVEINENKNALLLSPSASM
jgi:hypothetical protein